MGVDASFLESSVAVFLRGRHRATALAFGPVLRTNPRLNSRDISSCPAISRGGEPARMVAFGWCTAAPATADILGGRSRARPSVTGVRHQSATTGQTVGRSTRPDRRPTRSSPVNCAFAAVSRVMSGPRVASRARPASSGGAFRTPGPVRTGPGFQRRTGARPWRAAALPGTDSQHHRHLSAPLPRRSRQSRVPAALGSDSEQHRAGGFPQRR